MTLRRLAWLFGSVLLLGCGARTPFDEDPARGSDAGRPDAGARDAGAGRDAGALPDAGSTDDRLSRALHCDMQPEQALRATVREVACYVDDDGFPGNDPTVRGLYEAWEAGLLGMPSADVMTWLPGFRARGCGAWRCIAEADSCAALAECDRAEVLEEMCEGFRPRCAGDTLARCAQGRGLVPVFDCTLLGARCEDGACQLGDCRIGDGPEPLSCDGDDLVLCDGALRAPCAAHGPGAECNSFYIGGELPTRWCGPNQAGGYNTPVTCADGSIRFESVSGVAVGFDCDVAGYAGCDDRGCSP